MADILAHDGQDTTALAHCLQHKNLSLGEPLTLEQGNALPLGAHANSDEIVVLLSGLCWSEWQLAPGRRRILELYCPDDFIHLSAFPPLLGLQLVAVEKTEMQKIRLEDLQGNILQECDFAAHIFEYVRRHQRRQAALISVLGGLQAEARVAALLVELSLRLNQHSRDKHPIYQIPLTRQDIADHLALNADTLSRIFSRLRSDGVIQRVGRDTIIIKDWQALLDLCPISDALLAEYHPQRKN